MTPARAPEDRSLRILHVDDVPMNLQIIQDILTTFGHISVMASSGAEALDHLRRETFDVVLMDIHMPGMDGLEVVRHLRSMAGPGRDTPVIALSAYVLSRKREEYLALGFNDFLTMPILMFDLITSIQRASGGIVAADHRLVSQ